MGRRGRRLRSVVAVAQGLRWLRDVRVLLAIVAGLVALLGGDCEGSVTHSWNVDSTSMSVLP